MGVMVLKLRQRLINRKRMMGSRDRQASLTFVMVLLVWALGGIAHAQQPSQGRDEPATKFERFLLSKGTVRVREFYDIGKLAGTYGFAKFEVARAYTPGQKDYLLALRIEVTEAGRLSRDRVGTLDAEEVRSLATAIPQMSKMIAVLKEGQEAENTEVDFRAGSVRIGFFISRRGGATGINLSGLSTLSPRENLFIQAGEIASASAYFDLTDMAKFESLVNQAAAKIRELQQNR